MYSSDELYLTMFSAVTGPAAQCRAYGIGGNWVAYSILVLHPSNGRTEVLLASNCEQNYLPIFFLVFQLMPLSLPCCPDNSALLDPDAILLHYTWSLRAN